MSLWLTISASEGASLSVARKKCVARMNVMWVDRKRYFTAVRRASERNAQPLSIEGKLWKNETSSIFDG
jgi:hypothetical protein